MTAATNVLEISVSEEQYPRYDAAHGTPDPMVRRLVSMRLAEGAARFEQTDYGHPGRFNAWEPRGIDARLQARTDELLALCEALAPFVR